MLHASLIGQKSGVRGEEREPAAYLLDTATGRRLQTSLRSESGEATDYGLGWAEAPVALGPAPTPYHAVGHGGNVSGGTPSFTTIPISR